MTKRRIGILTGGGDVPGLNTVIKTVTYRSSENDIEVVGLRRAAAPALKRLRRWLLEPPPQNYWRSQFDIGGPHVQVGPWRAAVR
jgi:hypothetical protein